MKLLKTPDFGKRLRTIILRAAFVAPARIPKFPEDDNGYDEATAVIESVAFLGHHPEGQQEYLNFRDQLTTFAYSESSKETQRELGDKSFPAVKWLPIAATICEHPRKKDIAQGYTVVETNPEDMVTYIAECSGQLSEPAGITHRRYPISAVSIPIPWGDNKNCKGIPEPKEISALIDRLTAHYRSQVAVEISGPSKKVMAYVKSMLTPELRKKHHATLCDVEVEEGYIETSSESPDALDCFLSGKFIRENQKPVEKAFAFCKKHAEDFVKTKISEDEAHAEYSKNNDENKNSQLLETWSLLNAKVTEFTGNLAEIRSATRGSKTRKEARELEEQADRMLERIRRDVRLGDKIEEERIAKTTALYKMAIDSYEAAKDELLLADHGCQYTPWHSQMILFRSPGGFNENHPGETFRIQAQKWDKSLEERTQTHAKENHARETHLTIYNPKEGNYYDNKKVEPIHNPALFPPLEKNLIPAFEEIPSAQEPRKMSLDNRLSPKTDLWTETLLELDNLTLEAYNPVAGKPTGFKDATLWKPVLTRRGIPETQKALGTLGYELLCGAETHNYVERKVRKAEKILAPNYPLTPYESLAYFDNGARIAEKTIIHPESGEPLWKEGKSYHITPSWKRQTMLVDHSVEDEESEKAQDEIESNDISIVGRISNVKKIQGAEKIKTLTERRINFGYSTFIVEAEGNKTYEIRETVTKDTIGIEKERIAEEIEHLMARVEALEGKEKPNHRDREEIRIKKEAIEVKTLELDTWAPMLEDFLEAFPPQTPALAPEIYGDALSQTTKELIARFAPYFPSENGECSIKDYQLRCAALGAIKRGHLNGSSPGSGKAQPLDRKVLTVRGWIPMGEITLNDEVLTPDGKTAEVLGIFPQGKIPVFKITLEDGRSTEACGEHLWKVYNKAWLVQDKGQKFPIDENKKGYRVINTDKLMELTQETDGKFYLPLLERVDFKASTLPMEPYLLGAIIGDGGIAGTAIGFTNMDPDVIAEIRKGLLPDYRLKKNKGDKYGYYLSHKDGIWQANQKKGSKRFPANPYRRALKSLGLMGKRAETKFIPEIYKRSSHEDRIRLIQGLMDTDGTVNQSGSLAFYSTSRQLADDVAEVVWSLGGTAWVSPKQTYYSHNGKKLNDQPSFVVHIRHNAPWSLVLCQRKAIRISPDYQYAGSVRNKVVSVEPIGEKECQCILIDHPEHLYLTDDYIVTHNTAMAIMASWKMGHHYNWIICPTIALKTWAAELERVGLYHEIVGYQKTETGEWKESHGAYSHMRELRNRFHQRERRTNRLGKVEPEYYIISAESVSLGGGGNRVYSPWSFDHVPKHRSASTLWEKLENGEINLPPHWESVGAKIRVWSDRSDSGKAIQEAGFEDYISPVKFSRAIKACPKCESTFPVWSKRGHCKNCGHRHSGLTRILSGFSKKESRQLACQREWITNRLPPPNSEYVGTKTSLRQVPLYKMMGKHVGCKIIDEVHNWTNFHSQHGAALLQVRCKDAIVLSGTLCKTKISELEPSLCQVYEPNSGEFPYAPWGMGLFREQFETIELESIMRTRELAGEEVETRRKNTSKVIPEASNLTKLRALMHGVMCSVGEGEMEKVWNIKPIREAIRYVDLDPGNAAIYQEWERLLQEAYEECKTEVERLGMLRRARSQMTNLAYACDGPEKLEAAVAWIREQIANGERSVVVGPSTRFFTMLSRRLREEKIPFTAMGNTAPEKRFEILNKFRDSNCPVFLSRIRLVNVNFNQLTCCQKILFTGIDPSPAALRQMQKRLNRIGQTKDVDCTFLISRIPAADEELRTPSYEERLFALVLRREAAIKQTLQAADRQRDPHELQEMLKDRQTLNQLLEDIIKQAKTDPDLLKKMKEMAENKPQLPKEETPEKRGNTADSENTQTSPAKAVTLASVVPETNSYGWKPLRKHPGILQGELFSL